MPPSPKESKLPAATPAAAPPAVPLAPVPAARRLVVSDEFKVEMSDAGYAAFMALDKEKRGAVRNAMAQAELVWLAERMEREEVVPATQPAPAKRRTSTRGKAKEEKEEKREDSSDDDEGGNAPDIVLVIDRRKPSRPPVTSSRLTYVDVLLMGGVVCLV